MTMHFMHKNDCHLLLLLAGCLLFLGCGSSKDNRREIKEAKIIKSPKSAIKPEATSAERFHSGNVSGTF